ncbi:MAG: phosphonopyruvate decarboxylase, partial [Nanoarchaeota archaeon]
VGVGALFMHMGVLYSIGKLQPSNLYHIVFNNFAHDSVGGQPTAADAIDISALAKANGYKETFLAQTAEEIRHGLLKMKNAAGPVLLEIRCNKGARKDLGRPTQSPLENKKHFVEFLRDEIK